MNKNTQDLLVLTPFYSPNIGGVETHLDDLIGYLIKKNYQVWVTTYQPLTTPGVKAPVLEEKKNLTVLRLPWPKFNLFYRLESKPLWQFLYLFTGIFLGGLILLLGNLGKIKIIHGHGLAALVATVFLAKIFQKKAIVSLHTIYKFKDNRGLFKLVRPFLMACDKILILAKAGKDDLVSVGIPAQKIDFYSNWIDLKTSFKPADTEKCKLKLELPINKVVFLFVGRFSPEKGIKQVVETIKLLKNEKRAFFVLVGDGPLREMVKEVAEIFPSLVRWEGMVLPARLPLYYQAADFLIWASVDQDYFGRVPMGALGCGLPILLPEKTAYFGQWRKVEIDFPEGEIGYWIDPQPKETLEVIKKILSQDNQKSKLRTMRGKARKYALSHFSEKNVVVFLRAYQT